MNVLLDISRSIQQLGNRRDFNFLSEDLGKIQQAVRQLQGAAPISTPAASTSSAVAAAEDTTSESSETTVNGISGNVDIVGPGVSAQPGSSNIIIQPNAGGVLVNAPASITNIVETSGSIVTLSLAISSFMLAGASVYLAGLTVGTWLNAQTITITSLTATSITFTDPTSHGSQASAPETGTAYVTTVNAVTGQSGMLIPFTGTVSATYKLANPALRVPWWVALQAVGSGGISVSPNSLDIDGAGSSVSIAQSYGLLIFTDGSNYWTCRGIA